MCPPEKERTEEQKKQAKIVEANISVSKYFSFLIFFFGGGGQWVEHFSKDSMKCGLLKELFIV